MERQAPSRREPADRPNRRGWFARRQAPTHSAAPARGLFRHAALSATDGCGFILFTCLVSCLLMIINGGLVGAAYQGLADIGPRFLRQPRVAQATLFIAPVLLLFVQWWLLDRLLDFVRGPRRDR